MAQVESTADVSGTWLSTAYEWGVLGGYPQQSFKSSNLHPPLMNTVRWDAECSQGYTLLTLRGVLVSKPTAVILDANNELVWMDESYGFIMNLKIQEYKGEQYMTFWSGEFGLGFGRGTYYMLDSHYQIYKQFSTAGIRDSDFHEYTITPEGTALLSSYDLTTADLSSFGIKGQGWIIDGMFQEIDVETGKLLFEWRASEHLAINESFFPIARAGQSPESPFDFFHINSVDKDEHGNYIISSRFMHSVYCISGKTGKILWTLGGPRNDFTDLSQGAATNFKWQHHVNVQPNGMLSIFDNAKWMKWYTEIWNHGEISRGMLVSLDTDNMTVELVHEYLHPLQLGSPQQGSMQVLKDSGNVLIGWGFHGGFTEYTHNGTILCDTHINPAIAFNYGFVHSYRAFRAASWTGRPKTQPDIYMRAAEDVAYVSWMGATEVHKWVLQTAGDHTTDDIIFTDSSQVLKKGFETAIHVEKGNFTWLRIAAVDENGHVLATTKIIRADYRTTVSEIFLYICLGVFVLCFIIMIIFRKCTRAILKAGKSKLGSSTRFFKRGSDVFGSGRGEIRRCELEPLHT